MKGWIELPEADTTFSLQIDKIVSVHHRPKKSGWTTIFATTDNADGCGRYFIPMPYDTVMKKIAEASE